MFCNWDTMQIIKKNQEKERERETEMGKNYLHISTIHTRHTLKSMAKPINRKNC